MKKKYIPLKDLEVYKLARELSKIAWEIYQDLSWQDKKTMGDQFLILPQIPLVPTLLRATVDFII